MKTIIVGFMIALVGGISYSSLHDHNKCVGFLPENDLKISVGSVLSQGGGLTEEQFNAVIDRVEAVYNPILNDMGKTLNVKRLWDNDTVNASAQQFGDEWRVNMYGGLARHQAVGIEAFTTVLCHELGHHLGGAPKLGWLSSWASNEGQSDYYATTKCMRKLFTTQENEDYITNVELDQYAKSLCDNVFAAENNMDRLGNCYRSAVAGEDIALLFQSLAKMDVAPRFQTPDTKVVNSTNGAHPMPQCRLDTYFNGALCTVSNTEANSDKDATVGYCNRSVEAISPSHDETLPEEPGDETDPENPEDDEVKPEEPGDETDPENPEDDEVNPEEPEDKVETPLDAGTRPRCWYKPGVAKSPYAVSLPNVSTLVH